MDKSTIITKTTLIEIPYDAVNLIDFTVSMSPSHLLITLKNREEKIGIISTEVNNEQPEVIIDPIEYIKSKEAKPKKSIKDMIMDALNSSTGWFDYPALIGRIEYLYDVTLTKEQIRGACKRLRKECKIVGEKSSVDHRFLWMSVNDLVI